MDGIRRPSDMSRAPARFVGSWPQTDKVTTFTASETTPRLMLLYGSAPGVTNSLPFLVIEPAGQS